MKKENSTPPTIPMKASNPHHLRGLGNDIIEIERLRQSIERQGEPFLNRLFTKKELDYCRKFQDPVPHFAGRFAAKEAIVKAFGTGFVAKVQWHDIEVLNDKSGKPVVFLSTALQERFEQPHIIVSISHCIEYATAVAIWMATNH
jgi:holo-[acyl-carrier protein] synthase